MFIHTHIYIHVYHISILDWNPELMWDVSAHAALKLRKSIYIFVYIYK